MAPQATVWVAAAAVRMVARTGPMHGAHPNENAMPTKIAERGPAGTWARSKRRSRARKRQS